MNHAPLHGLTAATHTPFDAGGALNLAAVEKQAEHLVRNGVRAAFVGDAVPNDDLSLIVLKRT